MKKMMMVLDYNDIYLNSTTSISSTGNTFYITSLGNTIRMVGKAGITTGSYLITGIAGTIATLDRTVGTSGINTGGAALGGANNNIQNTINDIYQKGKELEELTQTTANAVKQLAESKSIAEKYKTDLAEKDKVLYLEEIKTSKNIIKRIDSIIDKFIGKKDKRQGITNSSYVTIADRISTASWYSSSRPYGITETEIILIQQVKDKLEVVLKETNLFFETYFRKKRLLCYFAI